MNIYTITNEKCETNSGEEKGILNLFLDRIIEFCAQNQISNTVNQC